MSFQRADKQALERFAPGSITPQEHSDRTRFFERFASCRLEDGGDIATLLCFDDIMDESTGETFPLPLVESVGMGIRVKIVTAIAGKDEYGFDRIYTLFVDTPTQKNICLVLKSSDETVVMCIHEALMQRYEKTGSITEALSWLLEESVFAELVHPLEVGDPT